MSTATIARAAGDAGLPAPVEDLLEQASEQGAVTFAEVRKALDEAGVGPAEAKRVIRLINERGITIGADAPGAAPPADLVPAEDDFVDDGSSEQEVPTTDLARGYVPHFAKFAL